jgi:Mn-dependent DtxR family transcriptional regulator
MAHGHGHSVDEYLETIYFLAFPIGEYRPSTGSTAIAARVAEMLGVSRASAGEMLKRLEADGLVERGDQKEAILTDAGIERAKRVVRKHRIIERFLTDFMGYTAAESHVQADELGDTFTDEMIERINDRLGRPERCPHGWPVEPEVEQAENAELVSLADLETGRDRPARGARRRPARLVLRGGARARNTGLDARHAAGRRPTDGRGGRLRASLEREGRGRDLRARSVERPARASPALRHRPFAPYVILRKPSASSHTGMRRSEANVQQLTPAGYS